MRITTIDGVELAKGDSLATLVARSYFRLKHFSEGCTFNVYFTDDDGSDYDIYDLKMLRKYYPI